MGIHGKRKRADDDDIKEWAVCYHGTRREFIRGIVKGYDVSKGKRFMFGKGIYSTPHVHLAEDYSHEFTWEGDTYKVVVQNRVNMADTKKIEFTSKTRSNHCGTYYLTENQENIRPYGILVKKVKSKYVD